MVKQYHNNSEISRSKLLFFRSKLLISEIFAVFGGGRTGLFLKDAPEAREVTVADGVADFTDRQSGRFEQPFRFIEA